MSAKKSKLLNYPVEGRCVMKNLIIEITFFVGLGFLIAELLLGATV